MTGIIETVAGIRDRSVVCFVVVGLILVWLVTKLRGVVEKYRKLWISAEKGKGLPIAALKKKQAKAPSAEWEAMGVIEPLHDLKWETVQPPNVYKFNPKYFLTMGLQNTTINHIVHIDSTYLSRLSARREILSQHPQAISYHPSAIPMIEELYTYLVTTFLPLRYPSIFHLTTTASSSSASATSDSHPFSPTSGTKPTHLHNSLTSTFLPLTPPSSPATALALLATNLDEDMLMLLPTTTHNSCPSASSPSDAPIPESLTYSLQSLIWLYPVGFRPQDKLDLSLRELHAPVPGYADILANSMDRYFKRLEVGRVVTRRNWGLATTPNLYIDSGYHDYTSTGNESDFNFDDAATTPDTLGLDKCRVRCELQTLFALPRSGGRVMAFHLYQYSLANIKSAGLGEEFIGTIMGLKKGNAPGMWRYKRAGVWAEKVVEYLRG